jgi:DnaA-homolog protein
MKQLPLGVHPRANAVLASFATGPNTEVVAALKVPGRDPLWLWGSKGCGKTHLLQAVCAQAGERTAYFPLDRSMRLPPEALSGYAQCRVLCVDDVDAVAGDLDWELALFRLFNEASELGCRLIFAAAAAPRQIGWRLEDWRSRAGACAVYHVRDLDEAGRAEAMHLRAKQLGLELPGETLDYLMKRMPRDLRSLFDILDELDEASLVAQRRLTVPFIRDALERHASTEPSNRTTQKSTAS